MARASWCKMHGLTASMKYFKKESHGEHRHAKMVRNYIQYRGAMLEPEGFAYDMPTVFDFYDELFTSALDLERKTTEHISLIMAEALRVGDYMTSTWIQKLVKIQIEEEDEATQIVDYIMTRGGPGALDAALEAFRNDPSAITDTDDWIGDTF